MILSAGGTTSVTRKHLPRLFGRSWDHAGVSVTLKTPIKAIRDTEKYPVFSLFLFCNLPLFLPLADPGKRAFGMDDWEIDRKEI